MVYPGHGASARRAFTVRARPLARADDLNSAGFVTAAWYEAVRPGGGLAGVRHSGGRVTAGMDRMTFNEPIQSASC